MSRSVTIAFTGDIGFDHYMYKKWEDPELGFCTETLAWIYAGQGYREEAKKIYSRLMLRYPEKSAYFASLIEKLDEEIKK